MPIKIVCDSCNKKIKKGEVSHLTYSKSYGKVKDYDLCKSCAKKLVDILKINGNSI